ncbi:hypothetical protein K458DRAFT_390911 [Lentithecium fluviatile CBS 122367]|uniref:Uncharacterized protein n=1 Tax=Lentithecium fluviatile CBS 122367 TaxID=1168545 RepID=A0A6G1IX08_9PLEO|nr:hypothetical protein K458DRAFT_390911 [Lentithecium fluviatile CBS 122367]
MPHSEPLNGSNSNAQIGININDQNSDSNPNNSTTNQQSPAIDRWLSERPWEEPFHAQEPRTHDENTPGTNPDADNGRKP